MKDTQQKESRKLMVHVYLTDAEKARIEESAKKLGISVSAYIKVKLFSEY
ncbi:hypothetical protein HYX01_03460 [Candidatus Woesearchaeota archaeon]|nr:hypothetical protein [Candidatus Woesearchaeota archaeon]